MSNLFAVLFCTDSTSLCNLAQYSVLDSRPPFRANEIWFSGGSKCSFQRLNDGGSLDANLLMAAKEWNCLQLLKTV